MGRNLDPEKLFDAMLKKKFSQLARKYSGELFFKIWGKIKITDADEAYFSACGWKPEMTIMEALNCLDEYCNYIEQVIQDYQKRKVNSASSRLAFHNNILVLRNGRREGPK